MPGRKYQAGAASYRYGFNGKENDNDVKGEGNQQDYGMRIYDPRIGKFLSVDPITKKYPMLTPYQFASNRPIDGIDQDGLEYISPIPKFEYNGTIESNPVENVPAAAVNAVISIINIAPAMWNSGVKNVQAIHGGTWKSGMSNELKQGYNNTSDVVYNSIKGAVNTPLKKQVANFGNFLNNPETLETGIVFALPFGASKLKVLNVAEETVTASRFSELSKTLSKSIDLGNQEKHIMGKNNYKVLVKQGNTPSILTADAQTLLDKIHLGSVVDVQKAGQKLRVNFGEIIGKYVDPVTHKAIETNVGLISDGKNGAHIVPGKPSAN